MNEFWKKTAILAAIGFILGILVGMGFLLIGGSGIYFDGGRFDSLVEEYPEYKADLEAIRDETLPICWGPRAERAKTDTDKRLRSVMACWGGDWGGHSNPDYDRYLHLGTNGIRALIEECRAKNPGKDGFYNGCLDAMDALDIVGGRIREMAAAVCTGMRHG